MQQLKYFLSVWLRGLRSDRECSFIRQGSILPPLPTAFPPHLSSSDKSPTTTLAVRYIFIVLHSYRNLEVVTYPFISVFVLTSSGNSSSLFDPAVRRRRKLIYTTLQHIVDWRINNFTDPDGRRLGISVSLKGPLVIACHSHGLSAYMIDIQTATGRFETSKI